MSTKKITWSDVSKHVDTDASYANQVIDDVLKIVNDNKKYTRKSSSAFVNVPEDISTSIAKRKFNVDAYRKF
jgi:hypothetical protein